MISMRPKRKKLNKTVMFSVLCAIVLLSATSAYFLFFKPYDHDTRNPPVTNIATNEQEDIKDIKDNPSNTASTPTETPTEQIPVNTTGSIVITQLDQADGLVRAKASVNNFKTQNCVYSFTAEGSKPVVREQEGTCKSLTVAQDYFDKIGTYVLTVAAYSENDKVTTSGEIYVQ